MSERKSLWRAVVAIVVLAAFVLPTAALAVNAGSTVSPSVTQVLRSPGLPAAAVGASGPLAQVLGPAQVPDVLGDYSIAVDSPAYNPSAPLTVTVSLKPSGDLSSYASAVSNPNSPDFRQYLTAAAVGAQFGNPGYASAVSYFTGYGLTVQPSATGLALTVSGTVSQIAAAFHTDMQAYSLTYTSQGAWNPLFGNQSGVKNSTSSRVFYANSQSVSLPQSLVAVVNGIVGLDEIPATPNLAMPPGLYPQAIPTNINWSAYNVSQAPSQFCFFVSCTALPYLGLSGANFSYASFSGTFLCFFYGICGDYQFLWPGTMHVLMGAQSLWDGSGTIASEPDQGQGVTIALVEVGCALPSDLSSFSQQVFGNPNYVPSHVTQIALQGPTAIVPNDNLNNCILNGFFWGWTLETELDLEYALTMAPQAHIDVIGLPSAFFSAFDSSYLTIAQYLTTGAPVNMPSSVGVVVQGSSGADAASVSITSNSYGAAEFAQYFFGAPMYITVEDQALETLNLVGVTNFFASGDGGAALAAGAGIPADAIGSTAVGGGQITALGASPNGPEAFPPSSNCVPYFFASSPMCFAPATADGAYTYWSYGFGLSGTFQGIVGGGFGSSFTHAQPWWQNALDTYSTGTRVVPQISGSAAFNMTIWAFGQWFLTFGGTSFATPITAGTWALIEEQANVAFGTPKMGDINPLLFAAHNAYEAGVSSFAADPYLPMLPSGVGFDSAPTNSFDWYYSNLSINEPSDPILPVWYPSLAASTGPGWTFLGGLGMLQAEVLDNEIIGQTPSTHHALDNEPFSVLEVTPGGLVPITTLAGGSTYTLQVVLANGQTGGYYNVAAYSGGLQNGVYGGGMVTTMQTGANGQFTYTPTYAVPPLSIQDSEYGYFLVTSVGSNDWSFQPFAVGTPPASGDLSLCVTDAYGVCQSSVAEVTGFTVHTTGFYNQYGSSTVELNGAPVADSFVAETVIQTQFALSDPTMPPASYAPGVVVGGTLSDGRGNALFWTNPLGLQEVNGELMTQIVELTAYYEGLVSNTVLVFVEPQSGSMLPQLSMADVTSSGNVVGQITLSDMKWTDFLNVSVGSSPGQYVNYTCPVPTEFLGAPPSPPGGYGFTQPPNTIPFPGGICQPFLDTTTGMWQSGIDNAILPVNISTAGVQGAVVVSILAGGTNDLSFTFSFFGFTFSFMDQQYPIYWQDPLVFLPASLTQSAAAPTDVLGTDTFSWTGTTYPGAQSALTLVSPAGSEVLSHSLSGTYSLNTATLSDGWYTVTYTETGFGASTTKSVEFYAANQLAAESATIASLQSQLATANQTITTLQSQLASATAEEATLQAELNSAEAQITTLQSELSQANANIATESAQIATLTTELAQAQANVTALTSQVSQLQGQIGTLQSQVSSLEAQAATLQGELESSQSSNAALQAQLNTVNAQIQADTSTISSLRTQVASDNATIAADENQISSLQSQVHTLQEKLNAKQDYVAPAWYTYGGGIVPILLLVVGILAGVGTGIAVSRRRRGTGADGEEKSPSGSRTPSYEGIGMAGVEPATKEGRDPEKSDRPVFGKALSAGQLTTIRQSIEAQVELIRAGRLREARELSSHTCEAMMAISYQMGQGMEDSLIGYR